MANVYQSALKDTTKNLLVPIGAIIFLTVVLILLAQYGNKKIVLAGVGLLFLSTLIFNYNKFKKEVFNQ